MKEEEDEFDAELSRALIFICNLELFACMHTKEPALDEDEDPLDWWRPA